MKLAIAALVTAAASAKKSVELPTEITANSDLGRSLMSQARRLDDGQEENDMTWVANYSLKFQGCRHSASLNADADGGSSSQVQTSKLAHFRLCPSDSCSSWLGGGCSKGYGDYVVDLATFAKSFVEGQRRSEEYACQVYMYENCDCNENDDKDDAFDRETCEWDCFANSSSMGSCIEDERNPYNDDEQEDRNERFEAQEYAECKEWEVPEAEEEEADEAEEGDNAERRRRKLEEEEEVQYFIGPYCSADGNSVHLGLYTDEYCTTFADNNSGKTTYKALAGDDLPYSSTSLVNNGCVSCVEQEDPNNSRDEEDDQDAEEEVRIADTCQNMYESAGKCETLVQGISGEPVTSGCSFINGIQYTRPNGTVAVKSSGWATFFICAFAGAFIGLAGVVYKLQKQVEAARRTPLLEREDSQEDKAVLA